ncbi:MULTISPECIES: outer membrane beta-barrel protein [Niastella]|uniref:TonB-dependent receptor n=1 Tax=Niastella soli TaxID=2821487 RepID=A0ABS3Z4M9_9BACT|nr:outer membrane beta-barrel protein [Niastella soli]MBO9204610.1 TonB-dependent receptor [Niastella soli]
MSGWCQFKYTGIIEPHYPPYNMRWSAWIIGCLLLSGTCVHAQGSRYGSVNGIIIDSITQQVLESVSIAVYVCSDSSLLNYALSDRNGLFTINKVPFNTNCKLIITAQGYDDYSQLFIMTHESKIKRLDTIRLVKAYNELKTVTVIAARPPMSVRGDTLEFNASSFKSPPNAMVEDLVKQLPGVQVDNEGNLTVNGKKVKKIMLNGQEFFGGDPKIAIKNLPKDIVDKLQVVANKSLEAHFNKTIDGNDDLAINLTLKKDIQKGWLGRASGGYGSNDRYEFNEMINYFKGSTQLSFIGNADNTNRGGGSSLNGGSPGLNNSISGGVNFSDNLGKRLKLNGSYFYNDNHTDSYSRVQRKNMLPDSTFFYNAYSSSGSQYGNHRIFLNSSYNVDTLTDLYLKIDVSRSTSEGLTRNKASSTSLLGERINACENLYASNSDSRNFTTAFFVSRQLNKSGRGFTLGVNYNYLNLSSVNDNIGVNDYYKGGLIDSSDGLNQRSLEKKPVKALGLMATYAHPLSKYITAILMYDYNRNTSFSEKMTNRFNILTDKYDLEDTAYTNSLCNLIESHCPNLKFTFYKNKFKADICSGLQFLKQDNVTILTNALQHQNYVSFRPAVNMEYNFSQTGSVSILYNGSSQQPSIEQLQPVPDNRNPLYVQLGNPGLKPSFFHNFNLQGRHSKGNSYCYSGLNFYTTQNQIVNETWFDAVGKQVSRPVNINGNYGVAGNLQYNYTWKNTNATLRVNLGSYGTYTRNNAPINKAPIVSKGYSMSQDFGLSFIYKQLLSIMPSFNVRYNKTYYNAESMYDASFITKTFSMSTFLNCPNWLIIENNLQYIYNSRMAAGFNKNTIMWNAALICLLFKKQQGTMRLAVYDILKQNAGVSRSITQNYLEDSQTQVLQRYLLLSFTYNLKKFEK